MLRRTKTVAEAGRSTAGWWTEMTKAGEAQIRVERTWDSVESSRGASGWWDRSWSVEGISGKRKPVLGVYWLRATTPFLLISLARFMEWPRKLGYPGKYTIIQNETFVPTRFNPSKKDSGDCNIKF